MARLDFEKFCFNRLASLVSYDNQGTELSATELQAATTELDIISRFGRNFAFNAQNPNFTTNSTTFQDALIVPFSAPIGANYDIFAIWAFQQNNNKNNTSGQAQVSIGPTSTIQTYPILFGQLDFPQYLAGFRRFTFASNAQNGGQSDVRIQLRRDSGNGLAQVGFMQIAAWRVT